MLEPISLRFSESDNLNQPQSEKTPFKTRPNAFGTG